jgi:hypothetical protein
VSKLVKRIILAPAIGDCLRYDLIKSVGGQGVTVVGVSQAPVAKAGDHSALFRVTLSAKSGSKSVPVYSDFLYVSQGRAQYFVNIVAPGASSQSCRHSRTASQEARRQGDEIAGKRPRPKSDTLLRQAPPGAGFVE